MIERKPCQIQERRVPYRTFVSCACGWHRMIFNRNALARASQATAAGVQHLKGKKP